MKIKILFSKTFIKLVGLAGILLLLGEQRVYAQQDFVLYNMAVVPQSIYDNPSFRPADNTVFVAMPLSSQYINFSNSGFKLSDLLQHNGDSLYLNGNNMLNKLAKENTITFNYHLNILSFGFAWKKNYFSFSADEKIDFNFTYSQEFMIFLWNGNGAYLGQTVTMNPSVNFMHYRDYSFGWSRQLGKKLALGIRLHYLYGMENVSTENSNVSLYTDPNNYDITAQSNVLVNTAGISGNSFTDFNIGNYLFEKNNNGGSIDFGITYKLSHKLTLSASVTNLGFITWNNNVTNYQSNTPGATFTYQGIDLDNLINNNSIQLSNELQTVGDSVSKTFKVNTLHNSYTTRLNTQLYANAAYNLTKVSTVGLLFYGQLINNTLNPAVTLSYNQQVAKRIMACISYSVYNRSTNNVGFGLAVNAGAFQFYTVSDNALGMILPQNAQNLMVRFGFNLTFRHKKPKAIKAPPTTGTVPYPKS